MKILSASQIRDTDAHTIKNEPVKSIDLMERASLAFVSWFDSQFDPDKNVKIFCGTGNNGGDGLAVSRLLLDKGYKVETFVIRKSDKSSEDFSINHKRLSRLLEIKELRDPEDFPDVNKDEVIIEGIFGSGLTRPVEGMYAEIIEKINATPAIIVSIDIASGLFCDDIAPEGAIIKPNYTVSFQLPKLAFLLPENEDYVGEWFIVDIGLDKDFIARQDSGYHFLEREDIRSILKNRRKHAHKGTFGRALLITGSKGKMGASVLAGQACLRVGTGLLTIHAPKCGYVILQTSISEAMVSVDRGEDFISETPEIESFDAIGVGPGIDTRKETEKIMGELLRKAEKPLVIDADGLNLLAGNRELQELLPENSILTPHPKEFERLYGIKGNGLERLNQQREFSSKYKVYVVLKGAYTSTSTPEGEIYFNSTGNPGMATGGSGDVLTGILTGLLAQGYTPKETAITGVYIHGLAGDLAAEEKSRESMVAGDIISHLGKAFVKLKNV